MTAHEQAERGAIEENEMDEALAYVTIVAKARQGAWSRLDFQESIVLSRRSLR